MEITRTSIFTGTKRTLEIAITEAQHERLLAGLELIQDIAPSLSADDRDFLMTGATPEEWDEVMSGDSEDPTEDSPAF